MSPYRSRDSIGSVCIVCYRYAAHGVATCPRCAVEMTSTTNATTAPELLRGLEARALDHSRRPKRLRNLTTYGGAALLAVIGFVVLVAIGIYDPEVRFGLVRGSGVWLWPAFVLYIVFGLVLMPIAARMFPTAAPMPSRANIPELVRYLGLSIVDNAPHHPPPKDSHG